MRKIILTGANGYVASHFIRELLNRNYNVVALARDGDKKTAHEKMKNVLAKTGPSENGNPGNLQVYSYSLLNKDFSLTPEQLEKTFGDEVDFFHFAASLKFQARNRDEIFKTNVEGTENAIETFLKNSKPGSRFFYISSVYSCGKFPGVFEEKFYPDENIGKFRNYYEQSKRLAENTVKKHIEKNNLNGYVLRLSQVVGDNQSGVTKTDYGIFDLVKKIYTVSANYPNKTLRIRVNPESTQNMIPIDCVVSYLMQITEKREIPRILHLVGKNPVKNDQINQCIGNLLPVNLVQDKTLDRKNMNSIERIVAAGMSFTGSYANTHLVFDRKNLDNYLSPNGNEITEQSLHKMIKYFIQEELPER